jgi:hypothetical protein
VAQPATSKGTAKTTASSEELLYLSIERMKFLLSKNNFSCGLYQTEETSILGPTKL